MEHVALDIAKTLKEKIAGLKLGLSTVAQKGDEKVPSIITKITSTYPQTFCVRFASFLKPFLQLSETVAIEGDPDDIRRSQLYIGELVEQRSHGTCGLIAVDRSTCQHRFGGFMMYVQLLLEGGADANHRNEGTLWTPLHAAAFQEHGKVHGKVMSHYSMTYVRVRMDTHKTHTHSQHTHTQHTHSTHTHTTHTHNTHNHSQHTQTHTHNTHNHSQHTQNTHSQHTQSLTTHTKHTLTTHTITHNTHTTHSQHTQSLTTHTKHTHTITHNTHTQHTHNTHTYTHTYVKVVTLLIQDGANPLLEDSVGRYQTLLLHTANYHNIID